MNIFLLFLSGEMWHLIPNSDSQLQRKESK